MTCTPTMKPNFAKFYPKHRIQCEFLVGIHAAIFRVMATGYDLALLYCRLCSWRLDDGCTRERHFLNESVLAAEGQQLAFEPTDYKSVLNRSGTSTIGGVFATTAACRIQCGGDVIFWGCDLRMRECSSKMAGGS